MSDYSKTTNFTAKDSLPTGNPSKLIKGSEFDTEFDALETAVGTKANKIGSAVANDLILQAADGDISPAGFALPNVNADITSSDEELNYNDGSIPGTAVASKTLVLGASKDVDILNVTTLTGTSVEATALTLSGAAVNTANGLCKLDGSADVPLAQIPDTLTGKSADKHNGMLVQTGTATGSATASGSVDIKTIALTSITTVYDIQVITAISSGTSNAWDVMTQTSGDYRKKMGPGNTAWSALPGAPSAGNIAINFFNNTGVSQTPSYYYMIYGT